MILIKLNDCVVVFFSYLHQSNLAPFPLFQLGHARKSKQMKEDKRSAVTRGWMPLVLERLSWLTVT